MVFFFLFLFFNFKFLNLKGENQVKSDKQQDTHIIENTNEESEEEKKYNQSISFLLSIIKNIEILSIQEAKSNLLQLSQKFEQSIKSEKNLSVILFFLYIH